MLLSEKKLAALIAEMQRASEGGPQTWNAFYDKHPETVALEAPLGEVLNPAISGFLWAWRMQSKIELALPIVEGDHFNAQGLEGKFRVRIPLVSALLAASWLPIGRRQIRIEKKSRT